MPDSFRKKKFLLCIYRALTRLDVGVMYESLKNIITPTPFLLTVKFFVVINGA